MIGNYLLPGRLKTITYRNRTMEKEKRRFSRVAFNVDARIESDGKTYQVSCIHNLSIGGCLLEVAGNCREGAGCIVILPLPHMAPPIEIQGKIVRVHNGKGSVQFTGISRENLVHLQNIIRYNSENPDRIEAEIAEHPGLK